MPLQGKHSTAMHCPSTALCESAFNYSCFSSFIEFFCGFQSRFEFIRLDSCTRRLDVTVLLQVKDFSERYFFCILFYFIVYKYIID